MGLVQGLCNSSGQSDVVFLEKNGVIKSEAMIAAPARLDRVFFERAQSRRRLARVANASSRAYELLHEASCERGDPAEMRQKIQRGTLAGENRSGVPRKPHQFRSRLHE